MKENLFVATTMSLDVSIVNSIIEQRNGRVLGKDTILKADLYAPIHYLARGDTPHVQIAGAPNFRRVRIPGTTISLYGVGQPTVYGIRALLNLIRGSSSLFILQRIVPFYTNLIRKKTNSLPQ